MISKPIIPVEIKIVSIIKHIEKRGVASLSDLLCDEVTLPDMIASFLGVLELIKVRKILVQENGDNTENALLDASTRFIINDNANDIEPNNYDEIKEDE